MKKLYFLLLVFFLNLSLFVLNSEGQWVLQNSGVGGYLYSVQAYNNNICWAVGASGNVLRTIDGGTNWLRQSLDSNVSLLSVSFTGSQYGWTVGNSGKVFRTTNGGINWSKQNSNTNYDLTSVYFVNPNTGWAVGDSGVILKTTDKGANWVFQTSGLKKKWYSVFFLNSNTGWITGGATLKTTDGGNNWLVKVQFTSKRCIYFVDSLTGWVSGTNYTFVKSTDGGESWGAKNLFIDNNEKSPPATFTSIHFKDVNTGWYTSSHSFGGAIVATKDGGTSWTNEYPTTRNRRLYDVFVLKSGIGWAVGQGGTILKRQYSVADSGRYMPLQVGNKWVYDGHSSHGGQTSQFILVSKITKDTLINGKKYYYCDKFLNGPSGWLRYDEFTGQLLSYYANSTACNNELEVFNFNCNKNDSASYDCHYHKYACTGTGIDTTFGFSKLAKGYEYLSYNGPAYSYDNWGFLYNIGPGSHTSISGHSITQTNRYKLKGAYINGVLYGDTSSLIITGIINESEPPTEYSLLQNYPNPFNPTTIIKFAIPRASSVKISIYDVSGREVEVLVNETLKAGTFKINWNGAKYSSGVYFYKIQAGDFSETKRMLLIK